MSAAIGFVVKDSIAMLTGRRRWAVSEKGNENRFARRGGKTGPKIDIVRT
jgi:hypothetical protein